MVAFVGSVYGVNLTNKLLICSYFFIFSLIAALVMAEASSRSVAFGATFLGLVFAAGWVGQALQWMHAFSFVGIGAGVWASLALFALLKTSLSFPARLFFSLSAGVLVDAAVMIPWELATFPGKAGNILGRSLLYKNFYAFCAGFCSWIWSYSVSKSLTLSRATSTVKQWIIGKESIKVCLGSS